MATKLPKSIIKKYGISKKAWSVYRAQKGKSRKASVVNKVAKRKRTTVRRSSRRSSKNTEMMANFGAFLYGVGRDQTLGRLDPLVARLGPQFQSFQYLDEGVMFGLSWALNKGKIPFVNKIPLSKQIGKAGMRIEAYNVGRQMSRQGLGFLSPTQTATAQTSGKLF